MALLAIEVSLETIAAAPLAAFIFAVVTVLCIDDLLKLF